jgi:hypothetical protein
MYIPSNQHNVYPSQPTELDDVLAFTYVASKGQVLI